MEPWFSDVTSYLQAHRREMVTDIIKLVRIPSIVSCREGDLPFGKNVDLALQAAADLFTQNGYSATVNHQDGYALAISKGSGAGIGIFAHCDVVPVTDDWVKTTPFDPIEENGVLYGRGIMDNKSGVIEALYALRALKAAGYTPKSKITVYLGGCEESGMHDIAAFVKNEAMPYVNIVPDGAFPVSVGEKGLLRVDCRSQEPLQDVKIFDGGKAYNVVLDRVQVELKNGNSFVAEGIPSHACSPGNSVNAAEKAAMALQSHDICSSDKTILLQFANAVSDCYGGNLNIASEGVFGKLTCANGITRIEDGHLLFTLDIRYGTEITGSDCLNRLKNALQDKGFSMTIKEHQPGFLLDEKAPEAQIILDTCRQLFCKPDAKPVRMSGATYARMLKNAYSIENAPDFIPEGLPKGHGRAHQSDEAISVDSLIKATESLALMIARLDDHLQKCD